MNIIGRERETIKLEELYNEGRSEFVAIYGRKGIGKTFLVNELFGERITFKHVGSSPIEMKGSGDKVTMEMQLNQFYRSLLIYGYKGNKKPKDWFDAFFLLEKLLISIDDGRRQLIFLDELPWLDTKNSFFITAFEGFWNGWASGRKNIMLIVCGSASSWILNKLINNHGGLYDRITYEIKLTQFTLNECLEYFDNKSIQLSKYDIVRSYMIFGGVPYYLNYFEKGLSLPQNMDNMLSKKNSPLAFEYDRLFSSVFSNPLRMKQIVKILSSNVYGLTRNNIAEILGEKTGGYLSESLNSLIFSDFITKYKPFGKNQEYRYKLTDQFCIFYHHFIENGTMGENYFQENIDKQPFISWSGFAFERVCFEHIEKIKDKLGISGVKTNESPFLDNENGVQIDMLIERNDNIVNLCEMMFYSDEVTQSKDMHLALMKKVNVVRENIPKRKSVNCVLITTFGLNKKEYFGDYPNVILIDDLFR